eukprot:CAMPEP_0184353850 /NCGR_PEP_ID=MMETSP1089-20130417/83109_1 /TAXON_ID=38269 ORGANISM="Gloeochaete wittrockiana, Strain SAG46.84" /NCGR_SAMPLE_ID=MMETSP1089 /ASSEMBLY_ACC=CAM_ASM_000445 /LENGTH=131 /DNA_ID=CAMNT_0026689535 /DNA_START=43 /DNA_END=435 /DNA_ORIENTATION=-
MEDKMIEECDALVIRSSDLASACATLRNEFHERAERCNSLASGQKISSLTNSSTRESLNRMQEATKAQLVRSASLKEEQERRKSLDKGDQRASFDRSTRAKQPSTLQVPDSTDSSGLSPIGESPKPSTPKW